MQRLTAALGRLRPAYMGAVSLRVSGCAKPGAFSWSDGSITVTTGLLQILSDDELAAAIAHEMGHLSHDDGTHDAKAFALNGSRQIDEEQRADAVAITLLRHSAVREEALTSVLKKVRDSSTITSELREAIHTRISLLSKAADAR